MEGGSFARTSLDTYGDASYCARRVPCSGFSKRARNPSRRPEPSSGLFPSDQPDRRQKCKRENARRRSRSTLRPSVSRIGNRVLHVARVDNGFFCARFDPLLPSLFVFISMRGEGRNKNRRNERPREEANAINLFDTVCQR